MKFLFRHTVLNKHLARGFQLSFFTRHVEGRAVHTKGIRETPTARPACRDTNQTFLSRVTVQEAAKAQKGGRKKSEKTCVSWVPLSSHSPCATAIGLPDSAQEHFRHTSGCRTRAEQTHPAIQEANGWCSQHINIVVVEMLRIQQPSKNYFISFLASLTVFFLNSMSAPWNSTSLACQISTTWLAVQLKHE